jgi:hypothetical protein
MPLINTDNLLIEANKFIKDPDVIIDVYDMTYVWVSAYHCEVTGYTKEEETDMRIEINSEIINGSAQSMAPESTQPYKPFETKVIITTKTGEKKAAKTQGIVIQFIDQPYLIGKMVSVSNL